jgi:hypothetical protein
MKRKASFPLRDHHSRAPGDWKVDIVAAYRRRREANLPGAVREATRRVPPRSRRNSSNVHLTSRTQTPAGNCWRCRARFSE